MQILAIAIIMSINVLIISIGLTIELRSCVQVALLLIFFVQLSGEILTSNSLL